MSREWNFRYGTLAFSLRMWVVGLIITPKLRDGSRIYSLNLGPVQISTRITPDRKREVA